ncbi:hypothetical protein B0H66DRAFT_565667 [Apodospora peruviana]|uniref:Rieske domain-containing protein n=1 Tax=Apodospora peruviana TaxID=516989 RepID=A0AAE0HZ61_9PEZI|nr:hypothetical protein B0H66DRAFT_565667 [Apodospora peruviana]
MFNPFRAPSRSGNDWFSVGLASSFPDLGQDDRDSSDPQDNGALSQPRPSSTDACLKRLGCKAFYVPKDNSAQRTEVPISGTTTTTASDDASSASDIGQPDDKMMDLTDQVLVFQYRGKFHAIDHQCPHSSFPLSNGIPFDIEDFGIVLSAGITCLKHGWSFDLFSGMADRGNYKLKIWEVQLRDVTGSTTDKEVWVRRKQRMG